MSIMGLLTSFQIQKGLPSVKKGLDHVHCYKPSRTISIDPLGYCRLCSCGSFLPFDVGNILDLSSFDEIWETPQTKEILKTIERRTYDYCDTESCGLSRMSKSEPNWGGVNLYPLVNFKEIHILLGIDDSCNLQCPSCRLEKRDYNKPKTELEKIQFATIIKLNNHITSLINNYNKEAFITVGSSGDAFYSLATVNMITNSKYNPLHRYLFKTNGLSMRAVLPKVKILPSIDRIDISIDGATKETHEKLRVGSNWGKLIDNIKWLINLPNRPRVEANFTVQNDNFKEIPLFKEIMEDELGIDGVTYTLYQQWPHITNEIYKKNAVHLENHINYQEYLNLITEFSKKISTNQMLILNPLA